MLKETADLSYNVHVQQWVSVPDRVGKVLICCYIALILCCEQYP